MPMLMKYLYSNSGFFSALRGSPATSILLVYLVLALTVDLFGAPSWHDGQRLLQLTAFLLIALLKISGSRASEAAGAGLMPKTMRWCLVFAFGLGLVSVFLAQWPRWALLEWAMTAALFAVAAVVAVEFRLNHAALMRCTVVVAFIAALLYGLKSIWAYVLMFAVGVDYGLGFDAQELFPGFSNVRFFGHVQTMLLPLLVLPALWWGCTALQRTLWLIVPSLWWALAIASGTRGSWVALLVGMTAALVAARLRAWPWLRLQMISMLAGAVLYAIFVLGVPEWLARPAAFLHRDSADLVSLRGRDLLWGLSLDWLAVHPWLGLGPMHFAGRLTELASHPHNAVLQWAVEWGAPAAALLTLFFAYAGLRFFWSARRRLPHLPEADAPVTIALLAALTGAAAQAMVDGVLVMPVSQSLLVLLAGWSWAWCLAAQGAPAQGLGGSRWRLPVLLWVLIVIVVACSAPEALNLQERLEDHMRNYPGGPHPRMLPRFWIHGWIPD